MTRTIDGSAPSVGFNTIAVTMNSPPAQGTLVAAPTAGTAASTLFELTAAGWVDDAEDLPLMYGFEFAATGSYAAGVTPVHILDGRDAVANASDWFPVGPEQEVHIMSTLLPLGDTKASGYPATVRVVVADVHGAAASAAVRVTVAPVALVQSVFDAATPPVARVAATTAVDALLPAVTQAVAQSSLESASVLLSQLVDAINFASDSHLTPSDSIASYPCNGPVNSSSSGGLGGIITLPIGTTGSLAAQRAQLLNSLETVSALTTVTTATSQSQLLLGSKLTAVVSELDEAAIEHALKAARAVVLALKPGTLSPPPLLLTLLLLALLAGSSSWRTHTGAADPTPPKLSVTASAAGVATISNVVDARGLSVPPDASAATRTAASELSGDLREILDAMMANHVAHNAVGCVPTPHPYTAVLTHRAFALPACHRRAPHRATSIRPHTSARLRLSRMLPQCACQRTLVHPVTTTPP